MRVGIDIRTAAATEPGQQRYLWRLGTWLAGRGHEVHLLTLRPQPDEVQGPGNANLLRLGDLSRTDLLRRVRELELDVLLLNPERARRYRGIQPNVLRAGYGTEHNSQNLRSFRSPIERAIRRAVRQAPWVLAERRWERAFYEGRSPPPDVVAQSAYMKGLILDSFRIPEEHVHVVFNAVDTAEFSPQARAALREEMRAAWSIPPQALCLLFLGHNFRRKGLWEVLRVLAKAGAPVPVHLLVAGKGTGPGQRRKAAALVKRYGLGDRVTLAGPVRPSIRALAAADALVHLSWHDAFGFVALEAMACGLPVVTTPYAGASELLEHGATGFVVDPASDVDVAEAIRTLARPQVCDAMGRAAAAVAARHDEPDNFRRVLSVMEAARRRAAGPVR